MTKKGTLTIKILSITAIIGSLIMIVPGFIMFMDADSGSYEFYRLIKATGAIAMFLGTCFLIYAIAVLIYIRK
jgi:hypothetical protein